MPSRKSRRHLVKISDKNRVKETTSEKHFHSLGNSFPFIDSFIIFVIPPTFYILECGGVRHTQGARELFRALCSEATLAWKCWGCTDSAKNWARVVWHGHMHGKSLTLYIVSLILNFTWGRDSTIGVIGMLRGCSLTLCSRVISGNA